MSDRFTVLTGCSGGGKSTLLEELGRRGCHTISEPGRRIVQQELARGGNALPWLDAAAFAQRAIEVAQADLAYAQSLDGRVFFDRGLIDAAAASAHATGGPILPGLPSCYGKTVFFATPWPEIHVEDPERRHGFSEAVAEFERLLVVYPQLGYDPILLPKTTVHARAEFVLQWLADN